MDTINLKDVMVGNTELPDDLTIDERYSLAGELPKVVEKMQGEYDIRSKEWDKVTDRYFEVMSAFSIEMQVMSYIFFVRCCAIEHNADTEEFGKMFERVSPWLINNHEPKYYAGNGEWKSGEPPVQKPDLKAGSGGWFTLRDHNK